MSLNFPATPELNQIHQQDGVIYQWTGSKWKRMNTRTSTAITEYASKSEQSSPSVTIDPNIFDYYKIDLSSDTDITLPSATPYSSIVMEINRNINDDNFILGPTEVGFTTASAGSALYSMDFNQDGTKLYTLISGNLIYEYDLRIPWNPTTMSYTGKSFNVGSENTSQWGIKFKPDGTRMYIVGNTTPATVFEYNLTIPWDISTAFYNNIFFNVVSQDTSPRDIHFTPDGTKMFMLGSTNDRIYEYDLTIPWNILTLVYRRQFLHTSQTSNAYEIEFSKDGDRMFLLDASNTEIHQYRLATPWSLSSVIFEYDFTTDIRVTTFCFNFSDDGLKLYYAKTGNQALTTTGAGYNIYQYELTTPWRINTTLNTNLMTTYSTTSTVANPYGITFNPDGNRMYISGLNGSIYQYNISTPWGVNTAVFNDNYPIIQTSTYYGNFTFSPDGIYMYVAGSNSIIYQYILATPWEVITAAFIQSKSITTNSVLYGFKFKPDGTKVYTINTAANTMHQYSLSTPWDISTLSPEITYALPFNTISSFAYRGIDFNQDGSKMYSALCYNSSGQYSEIREFRLSEPWNVSTASYTEIYYRVSESSMNDFEFKPDGTRMYCIGTSNDRVEQYSTGTFVAPELTWSDNILWENGTPPSLDFDVSNTNFINFITYNGEDWIGSPIETELRRVE